MSTYLEGQGSPPGVRHGRAQSLHLRRKFLGLLFQHPAGARGAQTVGEPNVAGAPSPLRETETHPKKRSLGNRLPACTHDGRTNAVYTLSPCFYSKCSMASRSIASHRIAPPVPLLESRDGIFRGLR